MLRPYLFAGDRQVAVDALMAVIAMNDPPSVVVVSDREEASHSEQLSDLVTSIPSCRTIPSSTLHDAATIDELQALGLDMAISVHFPELVREPLLSVPRRGWLNLHPALLPFNRGWHTPSWAIIDGTPAGATIHLMTAEVDAGQILAQREIDVEPSDTAHVLYGRILQTEIALLVESWPTIRDSEAWPLIPNNVENGSLHRRSDLFSESIQLIDLDAPTTARRVVDLLRGLTTNRWEEAVRFVDSGNNYRARIEIREDRDMSLDESSQAGQA
jgi:methionyl-tRNA formyltransferase